MLYKHGIAEMLRLIVQADGVSDCTDLQLGSSPRHSSSDPEAPEQ